MKTEQSIALDPRQILVPNSVSKQTTQPFNWRGRAALAAVERLLHKLPKGRLTLALPDGSRRVFVGQALQAGPDATVEIRNLHALRRLLSGGGLGFAESYIDGDWDSPDLLALLELALVNTDALDNALRGSRVKQLFNRVWHRLRDNSRRGSRRNISYHYDLGNRFYARWLDPSMTYSSGLSYARTLVEWREAFQQSWPQLREQGFDERFRRLWNYYLVYCEAGFRQGVTDVGIYRFRLPA